MSKTQDWTRKLKNWNIFVYLCVSFSAPTPAGCCVQQIFHSARDCAFTCLRQPWRGFPSLSNIHTILGSGEERILFFFNRLLHEPFPPQERPREFPCRLLVPADIISTVSPPLEQTTVTTVTTLVKGDQSTWGLDFYMWVWTFHVPFSSFH